MRAVAIIEQLLNHLPECRNCRRPATRRIKQIGPSLFNQALVCDKDDVCVAKNVATETLPQADVVRRAQAFVDRAKEARAKARGGD